MGQEKSCLYSEMGYLTPGFVILIPFLWNNVLLLTQ